MAQIRRKTHAAEAREYLLRAREMGIPLSWNNYEAMLPQDGFARLGLTCTNCLLGPCRLDPFARTEGKTVCGLGKKELVLRRLAALLGAPPEAAADLSALLSAARSAADARAAEAKEPAYIGGSRQVGLGVLQRGTVNLVAEGVAPADLSALVAAARQLQPEAERAGARGFHIVLAGDVSPCADLPVVSPAGTVEFALLTGLADAYLLGADAVGIGRNAAAGLHTAVLSAAGSFDPRAVLLAGADAYAARSGHGRLELEVQELTFTDDAHAMGLAEQYDCVAIFGGGSNLKQVVDDLVVKSARAMSKAGALCAAYGNAAVILAKYGVENVLCCGSNAMLPEAARLFVGKRAVVLMPELLTGADLAAALSLGSRGIPVLTATELPTAGCAEVADALAGMVAYAEAPEYPEAAMAALRVPAAVK